jgi:hypothetical protein
LMQVFLLLAVGKFNVKHAAVAFEPLP